MIAHNAAADPLFPLCPSTWPFVAKYRQDEPTGVKIRSLATAFAKACQDFRPVLVERHRDDSHLLPLVEYPPKCPSRR